MSQTLVRQYVEALRMRKEIYADYPDWETRKLWPEAKRREISERYEQREKEAGCTYKDQSKIEATIRRNIIDMVREWVDKAGVIANVRVEGMRIRDLYTDPKTGEKMSWSHYERGSVFILGASVDISAICLWNNVGGITKGTWLNKLCITINQHDKTVRERTHVVRTDPKYLHPFPAEMIEWVEDVLLPEIEGWRYHESL